MKRTNFTPNPALVSLLGLCPLIGVTGNFASGITLASATALGVLGMGLVAAPIRRFVPARLAQATSLSSAAAYVLLIGAFLDNYSPAISADLGFYLPLILVNCLLLHEMRKAASKEAHRFNATVSATFSYLLVAAVLSAIREAFGNGTLTLPSSGYQPLSFLLFESPPLPMLVAPVGGFLVLALLATLQRFIDRLVRRLNA